MTSSSGWGWRRSSTHSEATETALAPNGVPLGTRPSARECPPHRKQSSVARMILGLREGIGRLIVSGPSRPADLPREGLNHDDADGP
jgi:hypothetical protein